MTKFTKEWLQQKIAGMEASRDEIPFGLDEDDSNTLAALRIALASLEAKSRKLFTCSGCGAEGLDEPLESKCHCNEDGAHWVESVVYTAPPAPVSVPDERDAFNAWNNDTDCPLAGRDAKAAAWLAWIHRAAMLQGAEPVSPPYTLPTQGSEVVNEAAWKLFNMLTEHGALNGHQFNNLKGCFYEALKVAMGNTAAPHQEVK